MQNKEMDPDLWKILGCHKEITLENMSTRQKL